MLSKCLDEEPTISIITKIELLGFHSVTQEVKDMISASLIIGLTDDIVNQTIQLRKQYKIKLPDAIIAATAMTMNFVLLSRNTSDFNKIEGLNHLDLYKF